MKLYYYSNERGGYLLGTQFRWETKTTGKKEGGVVNIHWTIRW